MECSRRQYTRHLIPDDTLFVFCKDSRFKGWVTDISSHGMGFRYFPTEKFRQIPQTHIILAGEKVAVYIPDIPCKIIHDSKADEINRPFKGAATRLAGVQFDNLDLEMQEKLAEILNNVVVRPCV